MKAYITCPVSISKDRLDILPEIESIAKDNGITTFVFEIGGSPKEIFKRDYDQLKLCDIIIAEVSEPSHGVGIELGISHCLGHKMILLIQKGKQLSKLAQGIPGSIMIEYETIGDLKPKLDSVLKELDIPSQ